MSGTFAGGNNYTSGHTPNEQNTSSLSKRDNNPRLVWSGHSRDSLDARKTLRQFESDGVLVGIECLNAPDIACDAACAVAFCMSGSMCP